MKKNVGSYDGAARFVAGCAILLIGHHAESWWALLGFVPILSTFTECCLIYSLLKIDTTGTHRKAAP